MKKHLFSALFSKQLQFFFESVCDRVFEMAVEVEKKAVDLGLLEEDDIFEEFPAESKLLFRSKVLYTNFIHL